jgi:hypothetical protein
VRCPEDGTKITAKDFDAEYEFYACPKCGNLYTADEIEEANNGTSPRKRAEAATRIGPVAKGKKRRTEIQEDADLLDADAERILKDVTKQESRSKHRDEMPTSQIVNLWADEIQAIYHELGGTLDDTNAQDKALTLYREILTQTNVAVRDQEIPYVMCKEHKA